eukprot:3971065-Amphidinium_carterae.1
MLPHVASKVLTASLTKRRRYVVKFGHSYRLASRFRCRQQHCRCCSRECKHTHVLLSPRAPYGTKDNFLLLSWTSTNLANDLCARSLSSSGVDKVEDIAAIAIFLDEISAKVAALVRKPWRSGKNNTLVRMISDRMRYGFASI